MSQFGIRNGKLGIWVAEVVANFDKICDRLLLFFVTIIAYYCYK